MSLIDPRGPKAVNVGAIVLLMGVVGYGLVKARPLSQPHEGATSASPEPPPSTPPENDVVAAKQAFALSLLDATQAAFPKAEVSFAIARFALTWQDGERRGEYALERSWAEYEKLPKSERAAYIAKRAKQIMPPVLPGSFADAEPKIVPVVRSRIDHELARIAASPAPHESLVPEPPHVALTEDTWGLLAFETEDQFVRLDAAQLEKWNVKFADVWPKATARLAARASKRTIADEGDGVRRVSFGDGNDSARLLMPRALGDLGFRGNAVFAMPREDVLLVAPAADVKAVKALTERVRREGLVLRSVALAGGKIATVQSLGASPALAPLLDLAAEADGADQQLQRDALRRRYGAAEDAPFVATRVRAKKAETGEELSFVVHSEDVPTLLPRAEWVVFRRVDLEKKTAKTLGCARWDVAAALMKDRWAATPLWPARWLAPAIPTAAELEKLGCPNPTLAAMK